VLELNSYAYIHYIFGESDIALAIHTLLGLPDIRYALCMVANNGDRYIPYSVMFLM